jgi:hypothetical protein
MMKIHWKHITSFSLIGLLLVGSGCGAFGGKKKQSGSPAADIAAGEIKDESSSETADPAPVKDEISSDAAVLSTSSVKVRSYQQFYATYGLLLGIPSDNAAFIAAYAAVATSLPTTSSVKGFLGAHQLAAMKLASAGCSISYDISSPDERKGKFGIDFTGAQPIAVFNAANRILFAKTLLSKFWTLNIATLPDSDAEVVEVAQLVEDSLTNLSKDMPAITNDALIKAGTVAACSAVLASLPVSFY